MTQNDLQAEVLRYFRDQGIAVYFSVPVVPRAARVPNPGLTAIVTNSATRQPLGVACYLPILPDDRRYTWTQVKRPGTVLQGSGQSFADAIEEARTPKTIAHNYSNWVRSLVTHHP